MSANVVVGGASLVLALVVLRVVWGAAVWFVSRPESVGGWLVRGALTWVVGKATGLI